MIHIAHGELTAQIDTLGSSLVGLSDGDFNLVEPTTPKDLYPGSILAPWPNRIKDGKYQYQDFRYQLPINELQRGNALHGLVAYAEWELISRAENEVILEYLLDRSEIYPGKLMLRSKFAVEQNGLVIEITAKNIGSCSAPYGVSIHTYLVAGNVIKNNELTLKIPAEKYLAVDESRLLPIDLAQVSNTKFDFQTGRIISNQLIDHAFKYSSKHPRQVELLNPKGQGVVMEFDESTNWIQIHTADRDGGDSSRLSVAVEPMSCPPDAFNSKIDLVDLAPQQEHIFTLKIRRKP